MALTTYADLQASIATWLHRSDLSAVIPDFIAMAEKRIDGDLDARLQDTAATLSTTANLATVAAPADIINIRSFVLQSSPNRTLEYMSPEQMNSQYPYGQARMPEAYTVIGSNFYLAPVPDAVYPLQLIYKAQLPSLAANGTNYLMTNYPQVYLYASLIAAAKYIADDARLAVWEQAYTEAVRAVNVQDWASGGTLRVRSDVRA